MPPVFTADSLDLSRLPDPTLVTVDYEAILSARMADLKARYAARGIDYDETELELDSGKILEEVDAGREALTLEAINSAGLANMLAFSKGADLDHLGGLHGLKRMVNGIDDAGLPIMEADDRFRRRIQLAPEAYTTAGSAGAYIFHALSAVASIADASVQNPAPGEVVVTVMANREDPTPTADEVDRVREHLTREEIKPITDILTVQGAEVLTIDAEADLILYRGPDATTVLTDASTTLTAFLGKNKRLGRDLRLGAWLGRLHRDTVFGAVPVFPTSDIVASPAQVVWVRSVKLNLTGVDE